MFTEVWTNKMAHYTIFFYLNNYKYKSMYNNIKEAIKHLPSNELLKDNIRRYLARIAMSSHIRCCSSVGVGDVQVLSIN